MKNGLLGLLVVGLVASSTSFASGFVCQSEDGLTVKLYNQVHATKGTRNPAVLVVSSDADGTLLVRKGDEIRKTNYRSMVRYTVEGNEATGAEQVVFQVKYKEGVDEKLGVASTEGQIVFIGEQGRSVHSLECSRYKKGESGVR